MREVNGNPFAPTETDDGGIRLSYVAQNGHGESIAAITEDAFRRAGEPDILVIEGNQYIYDHEAVLSATRVYVRHPPAQPQPRQQEHVADRFLGGGGNRSGFFRA